MMVNNTMSFFVVLKQLIINYIPTIKFSSTVQTGASFFKLYLII